ncbi:C2 domain-containing protein C31G5.15 [Triticum urartu]|uniref:phosphatidylserine decarboxylase n=1 Tax=Triticum urartu TaxID=4572 RepID=M7ZPC1_TRIUA|nr:C2 domain-containing protein C31G5.15 [Triticum urartu]
MAQADLRFKDKFFACLSLGERTYRTETTDSFWPCLSGSELVHASINLHAVGEWTCVASFTVCHTFQNKQISSPCLLTTEKKVVIETNGPHIARISVFETNRFSKNTLVGYCEVDLFDLLTKDPVETEQSFARRVLAIVDYNEDGKLSLSEFSDLMKAFGNGLAVNKIEELFRQADTNGDGIVDMDELAALLADQQEKEPIISNCPVCGESLGKYDKINDMIHMTLCFDEGTGNQIMTGGFLTDKQAAYGWMFKLSEWANFSSYDVGLRSGSTASHILVFDRRTKRLVEEAIDGKIVLSMRALYQSKVGLTLIDSGVKDILKNLSEKQGKKMNSPESAKDIPKFLELFAGQINMDETKDPIESFKGRKFSIEGLLGADAHHNAFKNGSLVIFRLAPQDYHRFHVPVSGTVEKFVDIPGCLYTVNPIAVNSKYCNVFTENKRVISIISTSEFGKVAFVAIGATMVGSITFVKKEGDYVHKGDEFGYFSFGGSTVICVFEKDAIQFDADLLANSERSLETLVEVGTTLGVSKRNRGLEVSELQKCSIE